MKITDGKETYEIRMHMYDDFAGLSPDWSLDFFEAGSLPSDELTDTYSVDDVDLCILEATEWKATSKSNLVFVSEI